MDFINIENNKKKIYNVEYHNYLELFLSDKKLLLSLSSNTISFQANSIQSLDQYIKNKFLNNNYINNFIYDLGSQILFLKDNNIGILYFSLSDIIIINDTHFLFINPTKLFKKGNNSFLKEIEDPLTKFISPELEKKDINISLLDYSTSYYSLAKLILYAFDLSLEKLYYTNIYFFLQRSLKTDPLKRDFLYI